MLALAIKVCASLFGARLASVFLRFLLAGAETQVRVAWQGLVFGSTFVALLWALSGLSLTL